jgi:uncharacterized membrane protein (UPF0127 family)
MKLSAILAAAVAAMAILGCERTAPQEQTARVDSPTWMNSQGGSRRAPLEPRRTPLESIPTLPLKVKDVEITAWVADTDEVRTEGLMFVTKDQMPEDHGMLFVFPDVQYLGFWMKNTIIPLDIAFMRSDGTIVTIHTMTPLDESTYRSSEPAQYALEMHAGWFERHGIKVGDKVDLSPLVGESRE